MLVSWHPNKPVSCTEHGPLSDGPLPRVDGQILVLEHVRDLHNTHDEKLSAALDKMRAQRANVA